MTHNQQIHHDQSVYNDQPIHHLESERFMKKPRLLNGIPDHKLFAFSPVFSDMECLKWIYYNTTFIDNNIINLLGSFGNLEAIQWMYSKGVTVSDEICEIAASCGHVNILKYAHNIGLDLHPETTCTIAASSAKLDCVIYLLTFDPSQIRTIDIYIAPNQWYTLARRYIQSIYFVDKPLMFHDFLNFEDPNKSKVHRTMIKNMAIHFICKIYETLPLIAPLCDLIMDYCA